MRTTKPRRVTRGAVLRVVAPSGPFDADAFHRGVAFLSERYEVRVGDSIHARDGFLAGSDERRLRELREALADPDTSAIVAARGGYGSTRLLEDLSTTEIRGAGKWLVGFSDITALHALWARAGVQSLHGPMVAWLGNADDLQRAQWVAALEGTHPPFTDLDVWCDGDLAEGHLVGGNLAVLCSLVGTPFAPPLTNAVLFLEEVGEAPYRIDRMLTTLRQAGWFHRVRAVVVGEFIGCAGAKGIEADDVLRERLGDLGVPVLAGLGVGHGPRNRALPFGAVAQVDSESNQVSFLGD
ncbi:MAG: LD-carboxypeptidase [Myxococcota bacterium]